MDIKTAELLNALRIYAEPLHLSDSGVYVLSSKNVDNHTLPQTSETYIALNDLLSRHSAAAIAQEIRTAAAEDRPAIMNVPKNWQYLTADIGSSMFLLAAARPEAEAIVARMNADRLAKYTAYRLACAQGVAVPPPSESEE